MVFSSIPFLFRFLPLFVILYFLAPRRMHNLILFLGSLIFYAWGEPVYVLLMLFSTVCDYSLGRAVGTAGERGKRGWAKAFLMLSLAVNIGVLGFFKYADFLIGVVNQMTSLSIPLLQLPLPIGISFYTFQTMSYTIDVYRGETKEQKNLLAFGVFVAMFPQLIAGPIVKYRTAEPDLISRHADSRMVVYGIRRFITGLAKKVLLANNIGLLWTTVSEMEISGISVMMAWLGILAFAFQIYFDFSGYSDMAIGMGAMLGFHFPENFRYPYISGSITEFWRRWHISLSSWFREYVYIPLGGNRKGRGRQLVNILIVWALTGIWHGAGWNFLLWGLWFAFFLILEKLFLGNCLTRLGRPAGMIYMALVVMTGWVFFAFENGADAIAYLGVMFGGGTALADKAALYQLNNYWLLFALLAAGATPIPKRLADWVLAKSQKSGERIWAGERVLEMLFLGLLLLLSTAFIVEASYNPFLYFRF